MKQLKCEMCGSADLVKQEGVFVCQTCGCKYSVEEAKKMMVEGTVEIKGTVQIDNSEKIRKMLINAKRAYSDKKYAEAETIYGQVLNEDTENPEAILYQGLSYGWQGNLQNHNMDKVGAAAKRAIEIAHVQKGDGNEFFTFAQDALQGITGLKDAFQKIVFDRTMEAYDRQLKGLDEKIEMLHYGLGGGDSRWDQYNLDRERKRIEEENSKLQDTADYIAVLFLPCFETVIDYIRKSVDQYKQEDINELKNTVRKYNGKLTEKKVKDLIKILDSITKEKKESTKNEQKKEIEKYWKEHPEEKAELDREIESAEKELESYIQENDTLNAQLKAISNSTPPKSAVTTEIEEVSARIKALTDERNSLGLFKGKEKKALDIRIDEEKKKVEALRRTEDEEHGAFREECKKKENEIKNQIAPVKKKIQTIEERISLLKLDLTRGVDFDAKPTITPEEEEELKALKEDLAFMEEMLKNDIETHKNTTYASLYNEQEKTINLEKENIKKIKEAIAEIEDKYK